MTNERQAYFPREEILAEARVALAQHDPAELDRQRGFIAKGAAPDDGHLRRRIDNGGVEHPMGVLGFNLLHPLSGVGRPHQRIGAAA